MGNIGNKKLALLYILQILRENSDSQHPITQEEIAHYLERDYGITIERKAISRNLSLLREAGFDIESVHKAGSYLDTREFEDSELRLLIDCVLCSKYINMSQSKGLIQKLSALSSKHFGSSIQYVHRLEEVDKERDTALFLNIELIAEAIVSGKQITLKYLEYETDKALHPVCGQNIAVSPYYMIMKGGNYYLLCSQDTGLWKNTFSLRVDRLSDIRITEQPILPMESTQEASFHLGNYLDEHPYMKPRHGVSQWIRMRIAVKSIGELIDTFGNRVKVFPQKSPADPWVEVSLKADCEDAINFCMMQGDAAELLAPKELRTQLQATLAHMSRRYTQSGEMPPPSERLPVAPGVK